MSLRIGLARGVAEMKTCGFLLEISATGSEFICGLDAGHAGNHICNWVMPPLTKHEQPANDPHLFYLPIEWNEAVLKDWRTPAETKPTPTRAGVLEDAIKLEWKDQHELYLMLYRLGHRV